MERQRPQDTLEQQLQPSGAAHLPRVDQLSQLPNELLDHIFSLVWQENRPRMVGAISRALRPFTPPNLYYSAQVDSYERLTQLCRSLASGTSLGPLVRTLSIRIQGKKGPQSWTNELQADPGYPTCAELVQLFEAMPNLEELVLVGCTNAARILLAHELEDGSLPSLAKLTVEQGFPSDPFGPRLYSHLHRYPNLHSLSIRLSPFFPAHLPALPSQHPSLDSITSLHLYANLSSPSVPLLLAAFPSLHSLELVKSSPALNYHRSSSPSLPPSSAYISTGSPSQNRPRNSPGRRPRPPPVHSPHLTLHSWAQRHGGRHQPPPSDGRGPSLGVFDLQVDFGIPGTMIKESGGKVFENPEGVLEPYADWEVPGWSEELTRTGAKEFLQKVRARGMEKDGVIVLALEMHDNFEHELVLVAEEKERRARIPREEEGQESA